MDNRQLPEVFCKHRSPGLIRYLMPILLACILHPGRAQSDSCTLRISLLTCSPGKDLYALFGHSALRVQDIRSGLDIVFNYGTFDFEEPGFYLKFMRGDLRYFVSIQPFRDFLYSYQFEGRSVTEQELRLTCTEREKIFQFLQFNAREENRYYAYDFTGDNCTTRIRDMLERELGDSLQFRRIIPEVAPSFRELIHFYLDRGNQPWSKFGIDLLLGRRLDRPLTNREAMFLPDYLLEALDSATLHSQPLVVGKRELALREVPAYTNASNAFEAGSPDSAFRFTPLTASVGLAILGIGLGLFRATRRGRLLFLFDLLFFLSLGLIGMLMLFMWLGTSHRLTADNYNLLWAMPTHLVAALLLWARKDWVRHYFALVAFLTVLLLACWTLIPQGMHPASFPLALIAGVRALYRTVQK